LKFIGVIPARYASTRFPAKPLALLQGKPMIQWVVEGALKSQRLSEVIVATDHDEIRAASEAAGARVVMTDSNLPSGTDRIHAATRDLDFDVVINIQGDEPLVKAEAIDRLCDLFTAAAVTASGGTTIATAKLDMATLAHPISESELQSMNSVKVVLNHLDEALYFSRYAIPYSREQFQSTGCLKHIGMYAYTKEFLKVFCAAPVAEIEKAESLEQLRALYLGAKIKVLRVTEATPGVDTPEDLVRIENMLKRNP
jgi:3-deoxy-manno-octulosonate cytidylyltransferase (CMP-KDO synthetase)